MRFPDVTAASAGEHVLTLHYVAAQNGTAARISVNDERLVTVHLPGLGDDRIIGAVSVRVDLVAGSNTIWFGHNGNGAPD